MCCEHCYTFPKKRSLLVCKKWYELQWTKSQNIKGSQYALEPLGTMKQPMKVLKKSTTIECFTIVNAKETWKVS
jgi:hypothetical protein